MNRLPGMGPTVPAIPTGVLNFLKVSSKNIQSMVNAIKVKVFAEKNQNSSPYFAIKPKIHHLSTTFSKNNLLAKIYLEIKSRVLIDNHRHLETQLPANVQELIANSQGTAKEKKMALKILINAHKIEKIINRQENFNNIEGSSQELSDKQIRRLGFKSLSYTRNEKEIFIHIPNLKLGEGAEKTIHFAVHASTRDLIVHGLLKEGKTKEELAGDLSVKNSKCDSDFVATPIKVTTIHIGSTSRYGVMMPLYNGGMLEDKRLRGEALVKTGHEITLGLKAMHEAGLHHRDLKPANIMLHNDSVKIVDFGCVKKHEELMAVSQLKDRFFTDIGSLETQEKKFNIPAEYQATIEDARHKLQTIANELKEQKLDNTYRPKLLSLLDAISSYEEALNKLPIKPKTIFLDILRGSAENCILDHIRGGGSPPYLAPEANPKAPLSNLERNNPVLANSARDIYALGVSLCELALVAPMPEREGKAFKAFISEIKDTARQANAPLSEEIKALKESSHPVDIQNALLNQRFLNLTSIIESIRRGEGPATGFPALDKLLSKMLDVDPSRRPSLKEVDEFFTIEKTHAVSQK